MTALTGRPLTAGDRDYLERWPVECVEEVTRKSRGESFTAPCDAVAVAGRRDRDVARAAAEVLAERLDLAQRDADLQRVDVDADPAHGEDVEAHHPACSRSHSRLAWKPPAEATKALNLMVAGKPRWETIASVAKPSFTAMCCTSVS